MGCSPNKLSFKKIGRVSLDHFFRGQVGDQVNDVPGSGYLRTHVESSGFGVRESSDTLALLCTKDVILIKL